MNAQLQEIADRIDTTVDELLACLGLAERPAAPQVPGHRSHRLRPPGDAHAVAAPNTQMGKLIELGGGAALVVKFAEIVRDWERDQEAASRPQVIDVPPPVRPV